MHGEFRVRIRRVHLKEGLRRKIAHLIRISNNIQFLVKKVLSVFPHGLLGQGVVPKLVRPEMEHVPGIPIEALHRKEKRHIGKHENPRLPHEGRKIGEE